MDKMKDMTDQPPATDQRKSPLAVLADEKGAATLEWALLLAVVALPAYAIFTMMLNTLVEYYRMMTTLNALPFP